MNSRKKKFVFAIGTVFMAAVLYLSWGFFFDKKNIVEPYSVFYEDVERGTVESVTVTDRNLIYSKKGTDEKF